MLNWISQVWCKTTHGQAMWPIHGKYICRKCLREYPVSWERPVLASEYADPSLSNARIAMSSTPSLVQ